MGSTDSFNSQGDKKGNPFADRAYSDQFVRSATQPLQRRGTRPLGPDSAQQELSQADEQLHLCRVIIERFGPRMRLLKAAHQLVHPPAAAPQPPKGPRKPPVNPIAGLSLTERKLVEQVAQRLQVAPDLDRRAAIALTQYETASQNVTDAAAKLDSLRHLEPASILSALDQLQVSKLQGQVYPVCNLYEAFKDEPLLLQLFPPPQQPPAPPSRGFKG